MAAYVIKAKSADERVTPARLPIKGVLKGDLHVTLDVAKPSELEQARALLNGVIRTGDAYPQWDELDEAGFKAYFLSHDAFCVTRDQASSEGPAGEVVGIFYIKPNYPGRASHICNGGFVTSPTCRRRGVARFMATHFRHLAKDLGYKAAMFNLVFVTNVASIKLWRAMGFQELGTIPKAGDLRGHGFVDAIQFYYDLSQLKDTDQSKPAAATAAAATGAGGDAGAGATPSS